ncbi:hypothetical protein [Amycolatopsis sp. WGS_07]|uniref:hypothetical protein n=1 Tax=Amycolatopsis sp. WGS_07 TaxID=3076764 RepID=UPI0038732CD4
MKIFPWGEHQHDCAAKGCAFSRRTGELELGTRHVLPSAHGSENDKTRQLRDGDTFVQNVGERVRCACRSGSR